MYEQTRKLIVRWKNTPENFNGEQLAILTIRWKKQIRRFSKVWLWFCEGIYQFERAVLLRNRELEFFVPDRVQVGFDHRGLRFLHTAKIWWNLEQEFLHVLNERQCGTKRWIRSWISCPETIRKLGFHNTGEMWLLPVVQGSGLRKDHCLTCLWWLGWCLLSPWHSIFRWTQSCLPANQIGDY